MISLDDRLKDAAAWYEQFSLSYDENYGADHRRGWTVTINGVVYVQFANDPLSAVNLAMMDHNRREDDECQTEPEKRDEEA